MIRGRGHEFFFLMEDIRDFVEISVDRSNYGKLSNLLTPSL